MELVGQGFVVENGNIFYKKRRFQNSLQSRKMEKRNKVLEAFLTETHVAMKQIDSEVSNLIWICLETPDRVSESFLISHLKYIKGIVNTYNEGLTNINQIGAGAPAIIRMNADSENRSGAGEGPDNSYLLNLRSPSTGGTSTTGHLFSKK